MFSLKIISPEKVIFEGEADFAVFPGSAGQLGILPRHTPLLSTLRKGQIRLRRKTVTKSIDITGGLVEVLKNKVTVLIK